MDFFNELFNLYSKIDFPEDYKELSKVDKAISWYLADSSNQYITSSQTNNNYILEVDIKNAFTTICNVWFDQKSDFIKELNKLQDKKARNIFIATNLKETEYLKQLNTICKMIIMGILFEIGEIQLLELKKDGAVITCNQDTYNRLNQLKNIDKKFINFISKDFIIKVDRHLKYIRCNKTSYFWNGSDIIIKGMYKYIPLKLLENQKKIFLNEKIDSENLLKIYSKKYFEIIEMNYLKDLLKDYYICSNNKYLTFDGKYNSKLKDSIIDPKNYLKMFLYPIILSTKI